MISILMPLYTGVEFLEESIASVTDQTIQDWEIIIGISGYKNNSERDFLLSRTKKFEDSKIKVLDFPNIKGWAVTLNKMIKIVNNKIICLLDVDDKWERTKLEKQLEFEPKYNVVGTLARYIGESNLIPHIPCGEINRDVFMHINPVICSSSMFSKQGIFWDGDTGGIADYELWLRLNYEGKTFYNVPEILTFHRIRQNSAHNTKKWSEEKKIILNKWKV